MSKRQVTDTDEIYQLMMADEDTSPFTTLEIKDGKKRVVLTNKRGEQRIITELTMTTDPMPMKGTES